MYTIIVTCKGEFINIKGNYVKEIYEMETGQDKSLGSVILKLLF